MYLSVLVYRHTRNLKEHCLLRRALLKYESAARGKRFKLARHPCLRSSDSSWIRYTPRNDHSLLQHYIGGRSLAMAEITADDAKRMSCTKLTKLNLFHLVAADRGEPCGYCAYPIKEGRSDSSRCSEKVAPPPVERSRRTKKEQTPSPTLKRYPVVEKSLLMPTTSEALMVYGSGYAGVTRAIYH